MFKTIQHTGSKLLQQKNALIRPALQYRFYASANVFELEEDSQFKQQIVEESKNVPILVDAYADWCGPFVVYCDSFFCYLQIVSYKIDAKY